MEIKLTEKEKSELRKSFQDNLPMLNELNEALNNMEEYYLEEFKEQDEELKDILVNDETIAEADLSKVYLEELAKVKEEIEEEAFEAFQEIKEHFLEINQEVSEKA